jgi:hypothetical protein
MFRRILWAVLVAAASLRHVDAQALTPPPAACAAPAELTASDIGLPHVAAALKAGKQLDVFAIGSATMQGPRGEPEGSIPSYMTGQLRAAYPGLDIHLTVRGSRGLTAADMLAIMKREIVAGHFQLVLWQTATVEAVRGLPPEELLATLGDGATLVREAGADLVLVDPQYSRFLRANANLDPYFDVMRQAADEPGVSLFHRFDLMKYWVDADQIDLERAGKAERQKVADTLHECVGHALAAFIVQGADKPAP